jgi:RimJ/RimL family protein N-acetyltransferase
METDLFLRILEPDDLERVYKWHNDEHLYRDLIGTHRFVSRATVGKWLEQKSAFSSTEINFAICLREDSKHIGNAYIRDINWTDRNGVGPHLFIGDSEQRHKGYGKQAMNLILNYAFTTMGLNRLYGTIVGHNEASLRMCHSVGFVEEGKLRQHIYQDGQFKDVLFVGVCRGDWERCRNP